MNSMAFNPVGGLTDSSAYPTAPATEAAARAQIQDPSNQLRDYINTNLVGVFNTQGLSANGYQKLPGGLIIQWGYDGSPHGSTITYPVSFPTYQIATFCQILDYNGGLTCVVGTRTNSNFVKLISDSSTKGIYWLAIGC